MVDILEFGRPSEPSPAVVDLVALIEETVELASSRARPQDGAVRIIVDVEPLELETDAALLQRALLNLVMNAVEAAARTGEGDERLVRVEAREKFVRIRPENLAQAGRISGITPADVALLMVHLDGANAGK